VTAGLVSDPPVNENHQTAAGARQQQREHEVAHDARRDRDANGPQHRQTAVSHQQQNHHADGGKTAEPLCFTLRALLHEHRGCSGPARLESEARVRADGLERAMQRIRGDPLVLRVKAGRMGFGNEQRLVTGSVEPDVVQELRLPGLKP
jgi:hypothetical protein